MLSGTANIRASMSRFRISFDTAYKTRLSCKDFFCKNLSCFFAFLIKIVF